MPEAQSGDERQSQDEGGACEAGFREPGPVHGGNNALIRCSAQNVAITDGPGCSAAPPRIAPGQGRRAASCY